MKDIFAGTWYMQSIQGCFKLLDDIVSSYAYTIINKRRPPGRPSKAEFS